MVSAIAISARTRVWPKYHALPRRERPGLDVRAFRLLPIALLINPGCRCQVRGHHQNHLDHRAYDAGDGDCYC